MRSKRSKPSRGPARFAAEAEYAESIVRNALGDTSAWIAAQQQAVAFDPEYAPAILGMGFVE